MSIRTTVDSPDIRKDSVASVHLKTDAGSLGKITGQALYLDGNRIVLGDGAILAHGANVIVDSSGSVPWNALSGYPRIAAGEGLQGGGVLSKDLILSVDETVVRTRGDFTLSGSITLTGDHLTLHGESEEAGRLIFSGISPRDALDLGGNNIVYVGMLSFALPGVGIEWKEGSGWRILEARDDLSAKDGHIQFVTGSTRRATIYSTGDFWFQGRLLGGTVPWERLSDHPSIQAGPGLTGGGDLSISRTLSVVFGSKDGTAVEGSRRITVKAGPNLAGGGTIVLGEGGTVELRVADNPVFNGPVTAPLVTTPGTLTLSAYGENSSIIFLTAGSERMRISRQGHVGIGTTAPAYPLHVIGDVGFSGILQEGTVPWKRLSGYPSVQAGTGLWGGGSLAQSRTLSVDFGSGEGQVAEGNKTITVNAGAGLSGGGTVVIGQGGSINLVNADPGSAQNIFKRIADASGAVRFSAGSNNDVLQFAAGTGVSISFDAEKKRITYSNDLKAGEGIDISGDTISNTGIISLVAGEGISVSGRSPATIVNTDRGSSQNIFKNIADGSGTPWFSATSNDDTIRFAAGGILSVSFDANKKQITYSTSLVSGENISVDGTKISTVSNPVFSTSVTTPSLISASDLSLTAQGANNILFTTNSTERMRIDPAGRVGIGTSAPAYTLHVAGDIGFTGTLQQGTVPWARLANIPAASTSQAGIVQLNDTVTSTSTNQAATANAVKVSYDLAALAKSTADSKVAKSGDTMTGDLTLSGGAKVSFASYRINSETPAAADQASHIRLYESGTVYYGLGISLTSLNIAANESGGRIRFWTNGSERMRIDGSGNVGIGTTSPAYRLHVAGDIGFSGTLQAGSVPWARLTNVPSTFTPSAHTHNASDISAGNLSIARMPTGGNWSLSSNLTIDSSTLVVDIANDRVGIGTSSPQEQLHVAGKIRADQGIKLSGFEIVYNPTTRSIDFNFTS